MRQTEVDLGVEAVVAAARPENPAMRSMPSSLPFAELLQPWVDFAIRRLEASAEFEPLLHDLENELLRKLSSITAVHLLWWFSLYDGISSPNAGHAAGNDKYMAYVRWMQTGGWDELFVEYPGLAPLISCVMRGWIDSTQEFAQRLRVDGNELGDWLGATPQSLLPKTAKGSLSDSHHGQRSVIAVKFSGGVRLAYKPRPLTPESAFSRILEWIETRAPDLTIPRADVLSRGEYGWMHWIDSSAPENVTTYYERAGMLQCVLQVFGATDAHMANCVATTSGPVLVDCECMLTPYLSMEQKHPAKLASEQSVFDEIWSTGFLSRPIRASDEPDLSGLTGHGGQSTNYFIPVWSGINMDAMRLDFRKGRIREQANRSSAEGSTSKFAAGEALIRGFSKVYMFLAEHRDGMLHDQSVADALKQARVRILVRDTRIYTELLSRSLHPAQLRSEIKRKESIRDWLSKTPLELPSSARAAIVEAETDALLRLDVPHFYTFGESRDLWSDGKLIAPGLFTESGWDCLQRRISQLTVERLSERQAALRLLWMMTL